MRLRVTIRKAPKKDPTSHQVRMPTTSSAPSSVQLHREALQRRTCADWANREYVELISGSIKRIADFLNAFDTSVRGRLSALDEKLTRMERKVDYLEARIAVNGEDRDEEEPSVSVAAPTQHQMNAAGMPDESEA